MKSLDGREQVYFDKKDKELQKMMKLYALEKDRADAASKKEEYMRQKMARGAQIANSVKKCREEEVRRKNNESMGRAVQKDKEL